MTKLEEDKNGIKRLLSAPALYDFLQMIVGADSFREKIVEQYLKPRTGMSVLDIGCGTAEILKHLPTDIHYVGFDASKEYIKAAEERFGDRAEFFNALVTDDELALHNKFDLVLAIGVLHHLSDNNAEKLISLAYSALAQKGYFVAVDCCYVQRQNLISRWLIRNDRGQYVRSPERYKMLTAKSFNTVKLYHRNNLSRIPYDHSILVCRK